MTPRDNEKTGVYRDCKWCNGKGCLACKGELDAEYKRQFPDGPKPIITIPLEKPVDFNTEDGLLFLKDIIGKAQDILQQQPQ